MTQRRFESYWPHHASVAEWFSSGLLIRRRKFDSFRGHVKHCKRCDETRSLDDFGNNRSTKDGRQVYCKACVKVINADYYKRTPEKNVDRYASRARAVASAREYIWTHLKANPCVDCDESDVVVLEFDHVRGTKSFDISYAVRNSYSVDTIKAEITKCDVRCANCHRRVTAERAGYWSLTYASIAEMD